MPEVFTEENIEYHKQHTGNPGHYNGKSKLTEEDVYSIRLRYKKGESKFSIYSDFSDKITLKSFYNLFYMYTWKNINP